MVNRKGLVLFLLALLVAPFSWAAGLTDLIDRHGFIIQPGNNSVNVSTRAASIAAVGSNGVRAVVPVTASVMVPKATMALNAAKVARALSPLGAAFTAYQIYDAVQSSGVQTCPAPDFFCTAPITSETTTSSAFKWRDGIGNQLADSPQGACDLVKSNFSASATNRLEYKDATTYYCWIRPNGGTGLETQYLVHKTATCGTGYTLSGGQCVSTGLVPFASDQALADKMAANDWNGTVSEKIWKAVNADAAKMSSPITFRDQLGEGSGVTVTGSPVQTPETTVGTSIKQNADGSTSTETTKQQTTFHPSKDGNTVKDANITVKESTVTTTTTTNNTTNVTTTNTTTSTPPATSEKPEQSDLCKENPDIVACKKLGTLEATPLANKDVATVINMDTGWGASNGACPAPGSFTAMGKTIPVPWDVFCQFAQGIRPFLIAVGYMVAVGGFLGLSRKD